jgi:hypothetical protein
MDWAPGVDWLGSGISLAALPRDHIIDESRHSLLRRSPAAAGTPSPAPGGSSCHRGWQPEVLLPASCILATVRVAACCLLLMPTLECMGQRTAAPESSRSPLPDGAPLSVCCLPFKGRGMPWDRSCQVSEGAVRE